VKTCVVVVFNNIRPAERRKTHAVIMTVVHHFSKAPHPSTLNYLFTNRHAKQNRRLKNTANDSAHRLIMYGRAVIVMTARELEVRTVVKQHLHTPLFQTPPTLIRTLSRSNNRKRRARRS
jgi:hypothetical protein